MDALFKALGDPARRALLDSLRTRGGQTLSDLEGQLDMSRFGVMKHLKVLEEAHLITTRKVGRFKHHYLNPLPLQEAIDRWFDPFLQPQTQALSALKTHLEKTAMASLEKPDLVLSTFINCSHDALWDALTRGDLIGHYHPFCAQVTGAHTVPGDDIDMHYEAGGVMLSNRVLSISPKDRIEMTFQPGWGDNLPHSRCVYMLEPRPEGMKLTVEHYEISEGTEGFNEGWTRFLSSLKTWLETGKTHRFAPAETTA